MSHSQQNTQTSVLPTLELRIGMFVCDLDRPWIETPFLLEGILIEEAAQIATLQEYCKEVTVDHRRSRDGLFSLRPEAAPSRRPASSTAPNEVQQENSSFAQVCRHLRVEASLERIRKTPHVRREDGQSNLEEEMLYSAPLIDDVRKSLLGLKDTLKRPETISFREVGSQVAEMAQAVERNPDAMLWLTRLRSTDEYSYDHAIDVSVHLMVFGRFLGLTAKEIEDLGMIGLLQDIGKSEVSPEILRKPGHLSDAEYHQVQFHVASSMKLLMGKEGFPQRLLEVIASHHERIDGSGYPRKLKGSRIPLMAELSGVADSYCAMIRDRAYDHAVSSQKALEQLIQTRGIKFRDVIIDQFIQCMGLYPIGTLVELNTGEVGVVIQQNKVRRLKPRLMILLGPDKSVERHPLTLDLMMNPDTPTGQPYRIVHALPPNAYGIDPKEFYLT